MKIDLLETHDRYQYLMQDQAASLSKGAEECLKQNPLSLGLQQYSPYIYMYAHPRTCDDGVTKKMIWQPRLSKPKPETNSYLFRAKSHSDVIEICWMIPPREQWPQYNPGKICESDIVIWSIDQFLHHRSKLAQKENDDLPDEVIKNIYIKVAMETDEEIRKDKNMILKPVT